MGRVTPAFCYLILFLWPKFSFDIFTDFKMVGTSNSIANHKVKWRVLTFQACNTFYYKFSFLFQVSKNWKETSQNTSQTSRITQTKSRSQTCHKVRNNQKTNQFDGFRKIFGRFTNLELAARRVLPIFGWWRFLHILASLSNFWKSEKSKDNYISLKRPNKQTSKQTNTITFTTSDYFFQKLQARICMTTQTFFIIQTLVRFCFIWRSSLKTQTSQLGLLEMKFLTQLPAETFELSFQLKILDSDFSSRHHLMWVAFLPMLGCWQ